MTSTIVDADFFETDKFLFVLVGESDSRISAYAVEHGKDGKGMKHYTQSLKLDGGQKVASVSLCQPKGTENDQVQKFFVAVACWEQCKIQIYQLNFKVVVDRGGFTNGQLAFSSL